MHSAECPGLRVRYRLEKGISTLIAGTALAVLLSSCSAPAAQPPAGPLQTPERFTITISGSARFTVDTVAVPIERVWQVLPAVFTDLGYPGAPLANEEDLVFATPHLEIPRRLYPDEPNSNYFVCGSGTGLGQRIDQWRINFVMVTRLLPTRDGRTVVGTLIDGGARDRVESDAVPCHGTGKLERAVVDLVRQKTGG